MDSPVDLNPAVGGVLVRIKEEPIDEIDHSGSETTQDTELEAATHTDPVDDIIYEEFVQVVMELPEEDDAASGNVECRRSEIEIPGFIENRRRSSAEWIQNRNHVHANKKPKREFIGRKMGRIGQRKEQNDFTDQKRARTTVESPPQGTETTITQQSTDDVNMVSIPAASFRQVSWNQTSTHSANDSESMEIAPGGSGKDNRAASESKKGIPVWCVECGGLYANKPSYRKHCRTLKHKEALEKRGSIDNADSDNNVKIEPADSFQEPMAAHTSTHAGNVSDSMDIAPGSSGKDNRAASESKKGSPVWCVECGELYANKPSYRKHCRTPKHKEALEKRGSIVNTEIDNKVKMEPADSLQKAMAADASTHSANVSKLKENAADESKKKGQVWCVECDEWYASKRSYWGHCQTLKHKDALKKRDNNNDAPNEVKIEGDSTARCPCA